MYYKLWSGGYHSSNLKPSQNTQHWKNWNKKHLIAIADSFTAQADTRSSGIHHIQEVPPFGTISEFPHKCLLSWHNSSVPTHYKNTCMTSYHMNSCLYIIWTWTHVWPPIYQCSCVPDVNSLYCLELTVTSYLRLRL